MLEQYLRMFCDYQQTDWASLLPLAKFSYNNSKHSAISLTPFFANYGFHPCMSLLPPSPSSSTPAADSYVPRLREAQEILQVELLKARKAMEVSANRRRRPAPNLIPGQKMWLLFVTTKRCDPLPNWMFVDLAPTLSLARLVLRPIVWLYPHPCTLHRSAHT